MMLQARCMVRNTSDSFLHMHFVSARTPHRTDPRKGEGEITHTFQKVLTRAPACLTDGNIAVNPESGARTHTLRYRCCCCYQKVTLVIDVERAIGKHGGTKKNLEYRGQTNSAKAAHIRCRLLHVSGSLHW